ncbi:MAG: URC4/urg3 family protein, partial [Acetobacteraceae bacterium]|nr:URC4/urg3 family protein [Acetobacteraceae bacterium]
MLRRCARRRAVASTAEEVALLRDPGTIRALCGALLAIAEADGLEHFALHPERIDDAAAYVAATILGRFPDLRIPYHARWRHFAAGGRDRWAALAATIAGRDARALARL